MGLPSKYILPSQLLINPAMILISVDLPLPFGPSIPKTDPFGISKLTLLRTLAFPKHLLTFSIFTKVLEFTLNPLLLEHHSHLPCSHQIHTAVHYQILYNMDQS